MISWYAPITLLRVWRNMSKASSARVFAITVVCSSSPSPLRNRSAEADASWPSDSTLRTALAKTSWKSPPPATPAEGRGTGGSAMGEMVRMDPGIGSMHQIDGFLDHVFDRRNGRHIGFIISRRAHQVDHIFGGIDARKRDIAVLVRVRMSGHVPLLGIAGVGEDTGYGHAALLHLRIENRGKRRIDGCGFEDDVLAAVRAAFRRSRGLRVGQILDEDLRPRALRRHTGGADRHHRKQAH